MSDIVFILGAGASVDAGAPVMKNFLDVADNLWKSGISENAKDDFIDIFKALGKLQLAQAKANIDLNNIEDVFLF